MDSQSSIVLLVKMPTLMSLLYFNVIVIYVQCIWSLSWIHHYVVHNGNKILASFFKKISFYCSHFIMMFSQMNGPVLLKTIYWFYCVIHVLWYWLCDTEYKLYWIELNTDVIRNIFPVHKMQSEKQTWSWWWYRPLF